MLCNRVVNVADPSALSVDDRVDLEWWELQRRALRKVSREGRNLRILLPLGAVLFDGALLSDESGAAVIEVQVRPCEVLVIYPRDANELANLALELGNLHSPSEIVDGVIRTVIDGPVEALVADLGARSERQTVKFNPRRCVGMPEVRVSADVRVITS
jgi:urease accessory protein